MWQTPVTDRTRADVDHAREHRGDPQLHKGAQNFVDWNRLARNMYYVARILEDRGYQIKLTVKANWALGDIPRHSEINQFREDLKQIRRALYAFDGMTWAEFDAQDSNWTQIDARGREASEYFSRNPLPELPYTYYEKINEIERISGVLNDIIQQYGNLYRVSGTFFSGQLSYLPHFIEPHNCEMIWAEWDALDRTWEQIDMERRSASMYFNRCYDPDLEMSWSEWDAASLTWEEIDARNRTATEYFWKRV